MLKASRRWVASICVGVSAAAALAQADGAVAVGKKAPEFTAKSMSGAEIKLPAGYQGKLVMVDFWATWCPPCVREVPHLVAANSKYKDKGLVIVGVSLDAPRKSAEVVTNFVSDNKMTYEIVYADAAPIAQKYNVQTIPAPFLIDGTTGKILAMGGELRGDELDKTLQKHLAKAAGSAATENKAPKSGEKPGKHEDPKAKP